MTRFDDSRLPSEYRLDLVLLVEPDLVHGFFEADDWRRFRLHRLGRLLLLAINGESTMLPLMYHGLEAF